MRYQAAWVLLSTMILVSLAACADIRRGVMDSNIYYSTHHPNLQIKISENYTYEAGEQGEFRHQFTDAEAHRYILIHYTMHDPNETQIDYFHNPDTWIYAKLPNTVEIQRHRMNLVGQKWYVRDAVHHSSSASCHLIRDMGLFTDRHDLLKVLYYWDMPPYVCRQWKTTDSLSDSQQQYLKSFKESFAGDMQITAYELE